ncbi:hypothetical protein Y032_0058g2900 [Ancylostoma ceylanicum]|uniref:Uncharacterized protein n=1 Tax=Ancylostoma ceylanicum TaxID=53326 RepID=A0A016U4R5_9BILA|nr:hypothetical protein Y032_0058g2900 [Ancylostoma ceylanicum]
MCKFISIIHCKLLHNPYQEDSFFKTVLFDLLVYGFNSGESAIVSGRRIYVAFGHGAVVKVLRKIGPDAFVLATSTPMFSHSREANPQ